MLASIIESLRDGANRSRAALRRLARREDGRRPLDRAQPADQEPAIDTAGRGGSGEPPGLASARRDPFGPSQGPPADWLERVRKGAPHLLDPAEPMPMDRAGPLPVDPLTRRAGWASAASAASDPDGRGGADRTGGRRAAESGPARSGTPGDSGTGAGGGTLARWAVGAHGGAPAPGSPSRRDIRLRPIENVPDDWATTSMSRAATHGEQPGPRSGSRASAGSGRSAGSGVAESGAARAGAEVSGVALGAAQNRIAGPQRRSWPGSSPAPSADQRDGRTVDPVLRPMWPGLPSGSADERAHYGSASGRGAATWAMCDDPPERAEEHGGWPALPAAYGAGDGAAGVIAAELDAESRQRAEHAAQLRREQERWV